MFAQDKPILNIWCNMHLDPDRLGRLRAKLAPHDLRIAEQSQKSNLSVGGSDPSCRTADIAVGQPAVIDVVESSSLRWVHLTSAGYTRYDQSGIRTALASRAAVMSNSSSVYDDPCAQHVMAMMLAHNRRICTAMIDQFSERSWAYRRLRPAARILGGQRVLIVGFGAIGRRLVELLAPLGAVIQAIRRTPRGDEPVPTAAESQIDDHLPQADHVVDLLPSSPANQGFFSAARFAKMKSGAAFYNVGRGDTVDQDALLGALGGGRLGGAYLDVTSPEPLPSGHPLWTAPNCIITPHLAGGRQEEEQALIDHFMENFRRFLADKPLLDRIM